MGRKRQEINPKCGERLSELLADKQIKQFELANALSYTPQQISRIITGKDRLTEDFAHRVVEYFKTNEIEHDLFDNVRYEWLMCIDDDKTEAQRMHSIGIHRQERETLAIQLIELCGYSIRNINELCLSYGNGTSDYKSYPFGTTPEEAFKHEQQPGGLIPKGTDYEDFIHRTSKDGNSYFFYKPVIEFVSPRGSKHYFYNQADFLSIVREIIEFVDFKCSVQFRRVVDGAKNVYEWG